MGGLVLCPTLALRFRSLVACGTFATCSELVRMSVDRGRPEVAAARSKRRFGPIASIVGEADGTGIPLANPKTAYSLRGIVPQIRRPRAERGACQSGSDALLGGAAAALRTGADAPQGMMAVHQPGRLMRRGPGGV